MTQTDELKALLDEATEGPWRPEHSVGPENPYGIANTGVWSQSLYDEWFEASEDEEDALDRSWVCGIWGKITDQDIADAKLIAMAPDLAKRVLELEGEAVRFKDALEAIADHRKDCHGYDADVGRDLRDFDVDDVAHLEELARQALISTQESAK
ncbi:hypothetical protein [uncultured Roseobacter sp.]|uniref:hypothetical protein n=1 Tax=uncultured Roseobacter sp. TaxID=114847 RepID=UPI00260432BF|nr:hypothetical protein [uncultured Roseobacter sp.]